MPRLKRDNPGVEGSASCAEKPIPRMAAEKRIWILNSRTARQSRLLPRLAFMMSKSDKSDFDWRAASGGRRSLTSKFRYARVRRAMNGKVWPGRPFLIGGKFAPTTLHRPSRRCLWQLLRARIEITQAIKPSCFETRAARAPQHEGFNAGQARRAWKNPFIVWRRKSVSEI